MKNIILMIVSILIFGCEVMDDPIIGEWYNVGADNGTFIMFKPFKNDYLTTNIRITKDSLFSWGVKGQVLDRSHKILKEGEINNNITKGKEAWEKVNNTYVPHKSEETYFELNGDTLIQHTFFKPLNRNMINYYFKK